MVSGMWYWNTQLFSAYISHCFGLGSPRRCSRAVLAAPAHQEADARLRLEVDDEVGVVAELARALGRGEGGELQARGQLDQHFLERLALAGGRHDRHAHRVAPARRTRRSAGRACSSRRGARGRWCRAAPGRRRPTVSHWKASHTTRNGILYSPFSSLRLSISRTAIVFMRRVPRHVGHEDQQRVDAVRVAAPRVGDHVVHQAVRRQRMLPREGLVDADRRAVGVDRQLVRVGRKAQRRRVAAACSAGSSRAH